MTATINDLLDGSSGDFSTPASHRAGNLPVPVLTVVVNDGAVLAIARRLHDRTCLYGDGCELRDFHALDVYETDVRVMLAAMVQASAAADTPEISPCRRAIERRWFQGKWWCTSCGAGIRFGAGIGWVHTR